MDKRLEGEMTRCQVSATPGRQDHQQVDAQLEEFSIVGQTNATATVLSMSLRFFVAHQCAFGPVGYFFESSLMMSSGGLPPLQVGCPKPLGLLLFDQSRIILSL